MQNLFQELIDLLSIDDRLVSEGKLMKNKVVELALNLDPVLISHLLKNQSLRKHFFVEVEGITVFDKIKFQKFVSNKKFLPDSFTAFKNKIGFTVNDELLSESNEVVLAWPYKDCILEGGQDREDAARNEIFWNEVLAPDQIDRLLSPKVLTGFRRYGKSGESQVCDLSGKENLIVKGNNLLALSTLRNKYSEQVKLIYIDPPYNTHSDSFLYNDSFNHSTWLTFMRNRLIWAKKLLRSDGVIFVQCDDNEQAYLKVLMDEVFGGDNFINTISVNMKNIAGASGGGEDKKLKKNIEYIHIFSKNYESLSPFKGVHEYAPMIDVVEDYEKEGKSWKYTSILYFEGEKKYVCSTVDGDGNEIKIYLRKDPVFKSIKQVMKEEDISEKDAYNKYSSKIFEAKDAQSSIRTRIISARKEFSIEEDLISIEYTPKTGKNKGRVYEQFYKGEKCRLFAWLQDIGETIDGVLYKKNRLGTYWDATSSMNNVTKEGSVELLSGKKPEKLLKHIIEMSTEEGDLVMDYHLGSGTTAAVAHKLKRRYIGIEQLNYGENDSVIRLQNVIGGDPSGISRDVQWTGGGEFVYCELAQANQVFIEAIQSAKSSDELLAIWSTMQDKAFLSYRVNPKAFDESKSEFIELSIEDQRKFLIETLDKNMLYVPLSEIDDETYSISDADKALNKKFFG